MALKAVRAMAALCALRRPISGITGMLTGKFFHSMDAKGRVKLPSLWEPALENRFWLMTGIGKFLLVFSEPQFEDFAKQIMQLPFSESQVIILRYFRGMKLEEVAELMQISLSSVKRYLESGRKKLAEKMK